MKAQEVAEDPMHPIRRPRCNIMKTSAKRRVIGADLGVLLSSASQAPVLQLPHRRKPFTETTNDPTCGRNPSAKLKLQLFPANEPTRSRIEKDGHNPFLELTLRFRKKISSVLTHINTKWSSSSISLGAPMLFPYEKHLENPFTGKRWTMKDSGITAGDVYSAVGSPAIFRLRYGWFSSLKTQSMPSLSTPLACSESKIVHKSFTTTSEHKSNEGKRRQDNEDGMESGYVQSIAPGSDSLVDLNIGGLLSEASLLGKLDQRDEKSNSSRSGVQPIPITYDLSIGALLSEVSLQGKFNNNNSVSNENKLDLEQLPFQSDDNMITFSFGGLLSVPSLQGKIKNSDQKLSNCLASGSDLYNPVSADMNCPEAAKPSVHESCSSILDAEETCHAFSFRKFSLSGKNVRLCGIPTSDARSNSSEFPHSSEEDSISQKSKGECLACPQVQIEDSRSLGIRGIKWNDSLGPFDLGLSALKQASTDDGASTTGMFDSTSVIFAQIFGKKNSSPS